MLIFFLFLRSFGGLNTPAIQLTLPFPSHTCARHFRRLLSHGTIPRSLRLVWEGAPSRILADALLVAPLRSVRWVTFKGHQWALSIPQIIWFGLVDQRVTSIDLPKSLVIPDGRGNLFFQRSLRYSPLSLFKLAFRRCSL